MNALTDPRPNHGSPDSASLQAHGMARSLDTGSPRHTLQTTLIFCALVPIAFAGYYAYRNAEREMTDAVLAKRENISYLVASVLTEKLDRLVDVGVSLSTRVRFGRLVADQRWDDAIKIMANVPTTHPYIERIFLTDPHGVLVADTPMLHGVRGRDFSFRDWYLGVTQSGAPYVSQAYKRTAAPRINVVAVAIPIRNDSNVLTAILVLQVKLRAFLDWFDAPSSDRSSNIYIVDHHGRAVLHEKVSTTGDIVNLSEISAVQKVLRGARGIEVATDADTRTPRITAYAPVAPYGWGVILEEPADAAFAARDAQLRRFAAVFTLMLALSAVTTLLLLRAREQARRKSDLEALVADRTRELEASNRELEAFSYSVSHDLRAPLRSIDGFSRILIDECRDKLDADARSHLQRVRAATQRMGTLIDELLVLSRVTRADMRIARVDLGALARSAVDDLRKAHPERDVRMDIQPGLFAVGDPVLLRVVMENLIGNAWKFTGKTLDARVEFGASIDADRSITYFVRDNGVGFDMTYADKLFGAFQRLHSMDEFPGTGVGLASVQRIVGRHGGRVWADAAVGHGATFYFTLELERPTS